MIKVYLTLFLFPVLINMKSNLSADLEQDLEIYTIDQQVVLRGVIDHEVIISDRDAAHVIQHGIDLLQEHGGEIKIHRGEYNLNSPIRITSKITITGSGRGTRLVVGENNSAGYAIIMRGLKGTRVSDLTIMAIESHTGNAGIILDDCGDCKIQNVLSQNFKKHGFMLTNNSFLCELNNCVSANNGQSGFYFEQLAGNGRGGEYVPNLVTGCISYGDFYGFETKNAIVLNIVGGIVFQSTNVGYYLHDNSNSVLISGSRSFQVGSHAVLVEDSHEINISNNIFCWSRGHGIIFKGVRWGSCSANNIIDNGVRTADGSFMNGIVVEDTKGLQITGNAIFNWGDQCPMKIGISEDEISQNNLIANNNINFFTDADILSQGKGTVISNNVGVGPDALVGMDRPNKYPDFDMKKIKAFIEQ